MRVFLCLKLIRFHCNILLIDIIRIMRNFLNELFELFWSIFASKYGELCCYYIILAGFLYLVRRVFLQIILFTQGFFLFQHTVPPRQFVTRAQPPPAPVQIANSQIIVPLQNQRTSFTITSNLHKFARFIIFL